MKKIWTVISVTLILIISGCSSQRPMTTEWVESDEAYDGDYSAMEDSMEIAVEPYNKNASGRTAVGSATAEIAEAGNKPADGNLHGTEERKIIKRGYIYMETLEFDVTTQVIGDLLNKYNAYTAYAENNSGSLQTYERGYQRRFSRYTIKVPAEKFEAMYQELQTIAHVMNANEGREDVTSQFVDVQARLTTLRVQEERLLTLLEGAENYEAIVELEKALQETRYEIERFTTNLRNLEEQVAFSTIDLNLQEVYEKTEVEVPEVTMTFGERIFSGLQQTMEDILRGGQNLIVFLITKSPYLIVGILLVIFLVRGVKRRSKKNKPHNQPGIDGKTTPQHKDTEKDGEA